VHCALQVTFADALGAAKHQEDSEVTSKNEAKKLAFYLFWNIKPSFNRCASFVLKRFVGPLHDASVMQTSRLRQKLYRLLFAWLSEPCSTGLSHPQSSSSELRYVIRISEGFSCSVLWQRNMFDAPG